VLDVANAGNVNRRTTNCLECVGLGYMKNKNTEETINCIAGESAATTGFSRAAVYVEG
jgi:hypothetical protein